MNHSTLEKEQTGSLCSMIHKPFEETFLLSEQFFLLVLKRRNNDTISLIMKYFGGGAIQRQRWGYPPGLVTFWAAPTFQTSQVNRPAYFLFALLWTRVDLSPFLHHVSMWPCAGGQIRVHGSGVHIIWHHFKTQHVAVPAFFWYTCSWRRKTTGTADLFRSCCHQQARCQWPISCTNTTVKFYMEKSGKCAREVMC